MLATYERIAARHHGIGVAAVLDQACSLCGLRVVPHVFQLLRRDDYNEIFQCETCSRILYYVEPPPAAAAAAAAGAPDAACGCDHATMASSAAAAPSHDARAKITTRRTASACSANPSGPPAHVAYVDGASRGNPGPAAYAVVLQGPGGQTQFEIGKYFGRATNNVAEYYALIAALDAAQSRGIKRLLVRSDSELLVRQMQGRYKVKSADLKPLHERAQKLARGFGYFAIEHVPREQNSEADALANRALDETSRSTSSAATPPPPALLSQTAARSSATAAQTASRVRVAARGRRSHAGRRPARRFARAIRLGRCTRSRRSISTKAKSSRSRSQNPGR